MRIIRSILAYSLRATGIMLCVFTFVSYVNTTILQSNSDVILEVEGTDAFELQKWELIGAQYAFIIFIIVAIIFAPLCFSKARKLLRKNKKGAELKYNEPFILYLRSFSADNTSGRTVDSVFSSGGSEEEVLVDVLSEIAPVFAIGNPQNKYLPSGAKRIYVEEHEWKDKVIEMSKYAKMVVLRLGETDNFWWEVEVSLKNLDKNKLLFIVPRSRNFSTVATLYRYLFEHNIIVRNLSIEISKASKGSISSFLYFGENSDLLCKNMELYKFTSWIISYENMIRNSLSGFFERYGLYYKKQMRIKKARLLQMIFILLSILFFAPYGYFSAYDILKKIPLDVQEKCMEYDVFKNQTINFSESENLFFCATNFVKGRILLDDQDIYHHFYLETLLYQSMNLREFELYITGQHLRDFFILSKKYLSPEQYRVYVDMVSEAIILNIENSDLSESLRDIYAQDFNGIIPFELQKIIDDYPEDDDQNFQILYNLEMNIRQSVLKYHSKGINVAPIIRVLFSHNQEVNKITK